MTSRISFFHLDPSILRASPALADDLRGAGITLELPIWRSPFRDPDYASWEREWEKWQGSEIDWCVREGWDFVARMDDGFRTINEHAALLRWDAACVAHVAERLRNSGACVGVELCDEMNPNPINYPHLHEFSRYWHSCNGPPIACPSWAPQAYEGIVGYERITDYSSRQWPWWIAKDYQQRLDTMTQRLVSLPNDNRRVCVMIPVCGVYYSEKNGKPGYQKRGDVLYNAGMTARGIGNLMAAARDIVAPREIQYRLYAYDFPHWVQRRESGILGEQQTGAGPHVDKKRWEAILRVCKTITGGGFATDCPSASSIRIVHAQNVSGPTEQFTQSIAMEYTALLVAQSRNEHMGSFGTGSASSKSTCQKA